MLILAIIMIMKIIKSNKELQKYRKTINGIIGFVPTMGALHQGHISLIKNAKNNNDLVIVSIFVNPTQFLTGEDFSIYPNKNEADMKICELLEVDILFIPNINDMYNKDELEIKAPKLKSYILEGLIRPSHFDGVLQIVLKLFNLIQPINAYFGKKDAQQLILIKQMTKNLFLNINIIACEIVRDENGLALSSRNIYLSSNEKVLALNISKSLREAKKLIMKGEHNSITIINKIEKLLKGTKVQYIKIVSRDLEQIQIVQLHHSIILVAVTIGKTRLLDNIWI
jgi:pantoate--beta-alanine ligase